MPHQKTYDQFIFKTRFWEWICLPILFAILCPAPVFAWDDIRMVETLTASLASFLDDLSENVPYEEAGLGPILPSTPCGTRPFYLSCNAEAQSKTALFQDCMLPNSLVRYQGKVVFQFFGSTGCLIQSGLKKITRAPQYDILYSGNGKTSIGHMKEVRPTQTLEWGPGGSEVRISLENYQRAYEMGNEQHSEFLLNTKGSLVFKLKKPFNLSRTSRLLPNGTFSIVSSQKNKEETVFQIQQLEWSKSSCCFPTSGKIISKTSGNTLQFTLSCGGFLLSQEEKHKKTAGSLSSCSG